MYIVAHLDMKAGSNVTPLQQFVQELTTTFYGEPVDCSRSELAVDETNNIVMLLLRTKPELSEWMFSTLSLEYPWPLLQNYEFVLFNLKRQIMRERAVRLALSELMRAAMGEVQHANFHGASAALGTFGLTLYVPDAAESPEWKDLIVDDPRYPGFVEQDEALPELFVVHLPDVPVEQLNDAQLRQVAALSIGWNFLEVYPGLDLDLARFIRAAATDPQIIAEY